MIKKMGLSILFGTIFIAFAAMVLVLVKIPEPSKNDGPLQFTVPPSVKEDK